MSERLSRSKFYPIAELVWFAHRSMMEKVCKSLLGIETSREEAQKQSKSIRAKWAGEKRPPKKGEWYLSGSVIEAYRAPNDLTTAYHIAKLVQIETITREVEVDTFS